jgi:hypothetical protein
MGGITQAMWCNCRAFLSRVKPRGLNKMIFIYLILYGTEKRWWFGDNEIYNNGFFKRKKVWGCFD